MTNDKKLSSIYLAVYVLACILSLGTVWFVKNLITHAIVDANKHGGD